MGRAMPSSSVCAVCCAGTDGVSTTTTNSSLPRRATRSMLRTVATMRCATSRSTASPICGPRPSLMRLKRSSSSTSTAIWPPVCKVAPRRSKSSCRFGSPVSSSNCSNCRMRRSAARRSRRSSMQTWAKDVSPLVTRLTDTSTGISWPLWWRTLVSKRSEPRSHNSRHRCGHCVSSTWVSRSGTRSRNSCSRPRPSSRQAAALTSRRAPSGPTCNSAWLACSTAWRVSSSWCCACSRSLTSRADGIRQTTRPSGPYSGNSEKSIDKVVPLLVATRTSKREASPRKARASACCSRRRDSSQACHQGVVSKRRPSTCSGVLLMARSAAWLA